MNNVQATEYKEVTNDAEIRYKWYKEVISEEGEYYPLSKITKDDKYDKTNYKYVGKGNEYKKEYCSLSPEFYLIKEQTKRIYEKTPDATYVLIENVDPETDIKIYYHNKLINYIFINKNSNQIKINLYSPFLCGGLLFFVDTEKEYKISIYSDVFFQNKILTKTLSNQKFSVPDESWITDETKFITMTTPALLEESIFNKIIEENTTCAYQEKYVYKYNVTKEYYDDDYYTYVDGYIKDETDYKIYYKGKPIIETVEVIKEKIVEVPKIEYQYIEKIVEVPKIEYKDKIIEVPKIKYVYVEKENDSSKENNSENKIEKVIEYKTKTIEKKIYKIPVYIYIILILLVILIIILITKYFRKNVERKK